MAPNAKEVKISGEKPIGAQAMTRDDAGLWSITVEALRRSCIAIASSSMACG